MTQNESGHLQIKFNIGTYKLVFLFKCLLVFWSVFTGFSFCSFALLVRGRKSKQVEITIYLPSIQGQK